MLHKTAMLTRLRKLLLQSRVCAGCERYEISEGLLCVYWSEAKLEAQSAAERNTPSSEIMGPPIVWRLQDLNLLPPYVN